MNLELGDKTIKLSRIDLRLSLNAVPSLALFLKEERDAQLVKAVVGTSKRVPLKWQDNTLEIVPFGFEELANNEAVLHALLLEEKLETWFTTKVAASGGIHYGLYQNQSDIGGWTFLNSCLGHQVLVASNGYKKRIDQILPISSCLTRPIRQDNQQYLGTVISYLQCHLPELVGWSAIHASEEALRFIFFDEENALQLNETWENISAKLPLRFVDHHRNIQLRKTGMQIKADQKMALLMELARHGIQEPLSGLLETGDEADLIYLPGAVKLAEKLFSCQAVTYSFEDSNDTLTTTLDLSSGYQTPASTTVPSRFEGLFRAWDADDDEEIRVFLSPPEDTTWQLMDPKDSNLLKPDADLMAKFVLPTTPNDDYAGLYVRRVAGDKLIFKVESFNTPMIYGSHQKLTEQLEAATLSLNTEVLALSTSDSGTSINDMHGIVANAQTMMNRTESEVKAEAEAVTLAKNVQVKASSLHVSSKTDIANSAKAAKIKITGVAGFSIMQAATLVAAAKSGAPFCGECNQ